MDHKKIKILTIGVFTLALLNLVLIAFLILGKPETSTRMSERPGRPQMGNRGALFIERALNLSDDQSTEFRKTAREHRRKKDSLDRQIFMTRNKIINEIIESEEESHHLDSLLLELNHINQANEKELVRHFESLKKICDEKQLQKLNEILNRNGNFEKSKR